MSLPPHCDTCGGHLGNKGDRFDCGDCLKRKGPKKRITKEQYDAEDGPNRSDLFRLRTRAGGWRYYRSLAVTGADIAKIAANRLPGETMHAAIQRAAGK